jgi:dihydrofolate synthase / folylpolyglutamate synthase
MALPMGDTPVPAEDIAWAHRYLESLTPSTIQLGLIRVQHALARLGHPEQSFRILHVAGTNGKGSTCAFASSILRRRHRVGLYTSPHLHVVNERISVDGRDIDDINLAKAVKTVAARLKGHDLSYFEFLTVLALWHFAATSCHVVVLETGLGGRLDATNTVHPAVVALTSIGLDHQAYLGETLVEIAKEKAGIIKHRVPVISAPQPEEVVAVFRDTCAANEASLQLMGEQFTASTHASREPMNAWHFKQGDRTISAHVRLKGPHQTINAAVAVAACLTLVPSLTDDEIADGLAQTQWPGRFECFGQKPMIVLDGAHNPAGAEALVETLKQQFPGQPWHLVFGVLADKDYESIARLLFPEAEAVHVATLDNLRTLNARKLEKLATRYAKSFTTSTSPALALQHAVNAAQEGLVVVAGSLYLLGALRSQLLTGGSS